MAMPRGKLKSLSIMELSGVDRPCQQPATVSLMKRAPTMVATVGKMLVQRVVKQAVLTDEVDGHAHTIDLDDPACEWSDSYSTSYQTSAGATEGHSHAWIYDTTTGVITIAADSGHTHTVAGVVPRDVLAAAAVIEAAEKQRRAATAAAAILGGAVGGTLEVTVTPIEMRAPVSTPPVVVTTVKATSQENQTMDPKIAKMIAVALLLPEAQRAHVAKLATDDLPSLQAFMGLDAAGREAATAAALAADPVMYTTKSGGQIRKSHGELAKSQAEQLDRQSDQIAAQNEALTISKAKTELAELEKRAAEIIPMIGKSAAVRVALLRGTNAVTDEALRGDIIEALKGANAAFASLGKAQGTSGGNADPSGSDPKSVFNAELAMFAKSVNKSEVQATGDFLRTQRGSELYADAYPRNQA